MDTVKQEIACLASQLLQLPIARDVRDRDLTEIVEATRKYDRWTEGFGMWQVAYYVLSI